MQGIEAWNKTPTGHPLKSRVAKIVEQTLSALARQTHRQDGRLAHPPGCGWSRA